MSRIMTMLVSVLFLTIQVDSSLARKGLPPVVEETQATVQGKSRTAPAPAPGKVSAGVLQLWTFDNGGAADPQGWTTYDRTSQPPMFHVESFGAPWNSKMMWCGAQTACAVPFTCDYLALPGYGNSWHQNLVSRPFVTQGYNVRIQFNIAYDTEASYDYVHVEYTSDDGVWHPLRPPFHGVSAATNQLQVDFNEYEGPIRFRFRFESDGAYSDEDGNYNSQWGAARIDDILVTEEGVTLDSQNFEAEAPGATSTLDGDWQAYGVDYGDYAGLFDGDTVFQENPQAINSTHFWGFFNGSTETYACGGHPEQPAIPREKNILGFDYFIENEIRSPTISLAGVTSTEPVLLTFDVYRDLPLEDVVFYQWRVRPRVAGVWQNWRNGNLHYYGTEKDWKTVTYNMRTFIPANTSDIQVAIGVRDMCAQWCGIYGDGACHSHAPLIDNVQVTTSNTPAGTGVVTSPVDPNTGGTPVTITFSEVTTPGLTTVTTSPTVGGMPYGSNVYVDISTTAGHTGPIQVEVLYNEADLLIPEASLRLLHWDNSLDPDQWVDITTSLNTVANHIIGTTTTLSPFVLAQAVPTGARAQPHGLALHQNVPNPFNPTTTISYDVPNGGAQVSLRIYDAAGRLVRTLLDEQRPAGTHRVTWDGRNGMGSPVSSGVYFYKMVSGSFSESRRMVLLK